MTKIRSPLLVLTVRSGLQSLLLLMIHSTYEETAIIPTGLWLKSTMNWINSGLVFLGSFLYLRALQSSSLSSIIPLLSLTPVWVIFAGIIWHNELPDATSCLGIGAILVGYLFQCASTRHCTSVTPLSSSSSPSLTSLLPPPPSQEGDFILQLIIPTESGQQAMLLVSLLWSFSSSIERNNSNVGTDPTVVALLTQALVCFYGCVMLVFSWLVGKLSMTKFGQPPHHYYYNHNHYRYINYYKPQHCDYYSSFANDDDDLGKYSKLSRSHGQLGFISYIRSQLTLHNMIIFFIISFASILSFWIFSMATQTEYIGYVMAAKRLSMLTTLYIERSIMTSIKTSSSSSSCSPTSITSTTSMSATQFPASSLIPPPLSSSSSTFVLKDTFPAATAVAENLASNSSSTAGSSCLKSLQTSNGKWDIQLYASLFMSTGSILLML